MTNSRVYPKSISISRNRPMYENLKQRHKPLGRMVPTMESYVQFIYFTDRVREQAQAAKAAKAAAAPLVTVKG